MRKRKSLKTDEVLHPSESRLAVNLNVETINEKFTFTNGDRYEGGYAVIGEQPILVRQGRGTYDTDDFNRYEAIWERDKIGSDLHVRFNNGMEYRGDLDEDGCMSGFGTFCLPDGSSIEAIWKKNKPVSDIKYKEPLGYIWKGQLSDDGNTVEFMAGNHFWDTTCVSQNSKTLEGSQGSEFRKSHENSSLDKNLEEQ